MTQYDVLIIGAGQAGVPLARRLAKDGRRVAIAERKDLGGSCVNFGCTPTKAVFASARIAHLARRAADFGVILSEPQIDFPKVLGRAREIVNAFKTGLAQGLSEGSVAVLRGHARFTGRDENAFSLDIDGTPARATQVVVNSGARTKLPSISGLENVPYLHAGNWLNAKSIPRHIVFAGAGYIALEMAQFYRRIGAQVSVIGSEKQIASHEDADISSALQSVLEAEGIKFKLDAQVKTVARSADDLQLTIQSGSKTESLWASDLFVATGRRPNTDDLGLERVAVKMNERGFVQVDDHLATSTPGIWAAGDVRGGPMFTHTSWDDHRILESQLCGDRSHTAANRIIPYAIFTDPELGRVGMTENEARAEYGNDIRVAKFEMKNSGKATEVGETQGFIKLVAHAEGRLLGAAVLATDGAELVASYITLMNANATLDAICKGIYIHPTLSEAVQSAAMTFKA